MLKAQQLFKSYKDLKVLKGIDLNIEKGEILSIVGSSGAGKSTLLQLLGTLDKPDLGQISIDGTNITSLNDRNLAKFRNEKIGFVFQFHNLLPEFTAIENICIPAFIGGRNDKDTKTKALNLLNKLGLSARSNHKPSELSGGEQQRVAIARALINGPMIIFADEPTGNLDSANADELHQLIFDLRKELNQTFVIVTHNEKLANMADRKLVMRDGLIEN